MVSCRCVCRAFRALWLAAAFPLALSMSAEACTFPAVRAQIDAIIDRDAERGAKFRKEFTEGADSIAVLESLVTEEMRAQVDACRFEVAEYLTKRGFPPPH